MLIDGRRARLRDVLHQEQPYALAMFGARWPAPPEVKPPGNPRLMMVTLREMLRRSVSPVDALDLELLVDDEPLGIAVSGGPKKSVQDYANSMLNKIEEWITLTESTAGELVQLKGMLSLMSMTFAKALWRHDTGKKAVLYKDTLSLMHRTHFGAAYAKLNALERTKLDAVAADPAAVFGADYDGAKAVDADAPAYTFDKVVKDFAKGEDALSKMEGQSQVGVLQHSRATADAKITAGGLSPADEKFYTRQKSQLAHYHVDEPTEIGKGWGSDDVRTDGMIIEDRLVSKGEYAKLDDWAKVTDDYFRALVYVNSGVTLSEDLDDDGT